MKTLQVQLTGLRPLICHNGQMIDPTNAFVRAIKAITKKKTKTDEDHETIAKLEWQAGLYLHPEHGPIIPSDNIERCIQLGAQKSRIGKDVAAGVFMDEDFAPIQYDGPRDPEKMYAQPALFAIRRAVKVTTSRVMRVRPMIPTGWQLSFTLSYDPSIIDRAALVKAIEDAGALIGLGDWRPKFGRFLAKVS